MPRQLRKRPSKRPRMTISEPFALAGEAGTQYHYLAQDYDFAINAISINAKNLDSYKQKAPKWIRVEVYDEDDPPFDWFKGIMDVRNQLEAEGQTRAVELIEAMFAKGRNW